MINFKKGKKFMVFGFVVFFVFPLLDHSQPGPHSKAKTDLVVKMICRDFNFTAIKSTGVVKGRVINQGKVDAQNFMVYLLLYPSSTKPVGPDLRGLLSPKYPVLKKRRVVLLKAGQSLTLNFTGFEVPAHLACGEYSLLMVADPEDRVAERDKSNNVASCPYYMMAFITDVREAPTGESFGGELFPEVAIIGSPFGSTKENKKVRFGSLTLDIYPAHWTNTRLFFTLNHYQECGRYMVYLVVGNQPISNKVSFLLRSWIAEISPIHGASPGQQVTVKGRNFGHTIGTKKVRFGTAEAAVVSWSATTIVVTVPSLSPGTYPVNIEKDGEDACSGLDYPVL